MAYSSCWFLADSGSSPALNLTCEAQFDPYNASYNLIGRWEIANDPLVLDSLERFTAEAHRETRQRIPIGGVWKMEVTPQVRVCVCACRLL